ncbi:uncharacterized protein [Amphiura filiformis]|uniref:uncharacterized protein n=1 Tax=Amphiura filiformis TaxID=82378 RepID=UPI003B2269C3
MAQDGIWADHLVLVATAYRLQRDIRVVTSSPEGQGDEVDCLIACGSFSIETPIMVGHIWEWHYQSLQTAISQSQQPPVPAASHVASHQASSSDDVADIEKTMGGVSVTENYETKTRDEHLHHDASPRQQPPVPNDYTLGRGHRIPPAYLFTPHVASHQASSSDDVADIEKTMGGVSVTENYETKTRDEHLHHDDSKMDSQHLLSLQSGNSSDQPNEPDGANVFNVDGHRNRIFVGHIINVYSGRFPPLDNSAMPRIMPCEKWLIYYHPSDKAFAEMTKRRLEDKFCGDIPAMVNLWDEVRGGILKAVAHGGSTKLLSKFLCDYNFSVIIRTDKFAENEALLVNALGKISDQDRKNQILSTMFILNGTEQSLHECFENQGPIVKRFSSDSVSSDNSFWEDFLHCAVSVNRTYTAPTITVAERTANSSGDDLFID